MVPEEGENDHKTGHHTGLYEAAVQSITEAVKPRLHDITQEFVQKSVDTYAKDDPRFARMIEFEVRRRGDGAGLTQDVAEPLLWIGVKTVAALGTAVLTKSLEKGKYQTIGWAAALGVMLNNGVELFRLVPRYVAGLQGSLEMAKDRQLSIQTKGYDPFNRELREINSPDASAPAQPEAVTQVESGEKSGEWTADIRASRQQAAVEPPMVGR